MVTPRVTVLMPVYNAAPYLREAVDSILGQSFRHFEFIIIDDGSTDDSAEIIASYDDPRIKYERNEANLGITATLNKGIALAGCELIARMDADDISHPQRLQKQFGYMKRNPECALLSTWARVVGEDGQLIRMERYRSNYYYYNLTFECWIYHPTVMFRKSAVEAVGMYAMPYSEDYDLFWRLSARFKIANLGEPLLDYRLTSTSLNAVRKRREYEAAHKENVMRNIRYYMGDDFQITRPALECLQHDFRSILAHPDPAAIIAGLDVLKAITQKVLEKENVNLDTRVVRCAYRNKRKFILTVLARGLPLILGVELLLRARAWMILLTLAKGFLRAHLKQHLKIFRSEHSDERFRIYGSQPAKNS